MEFLAFYDGWVTTNRKFMPTQLVKGLAFSGNTVAAAKD